MNGEMGRYVLGTWKLQGLAVCVQDKKEAKDMKPL